MIEHSATMKVMLSAYGAIDRERGATQSAVVEDMLGCVRCGLESALGDFLASPPNHSPPTSPPGATQLRLALGIGLEGWKGT